MNDAIRAMGVLACCALIGCDTPSPPMWGAPTTRVAVDGHRFAVRHTGQRAESVRVSPFPEAGLREMLHLSRTAIEQASGCAVRAGTLYGDRVMAEAFLDCDGSDPARLTPQWRYNLPPG